MPIKLTVEQGELTLKEPFRISGHVFTGMPKLTVRLDDGVFSGIGEASGVYYTGDDLANMLADVEKVRDAVESGMTRAELQDALPPCGARNALDCAMWDLEASRTGKPVWQLAGLEPPKPLVTCLTIGASTPDDMARRAASMPARAIKLKLTGEIDIDIKRVQAVRSARGDVWLGVDANQGFERADLPRLIATLSEQGVEIIEQPLPRGKEDDMLDISAPMALAADESFLSLSDFQKIGGRFDMVNIKLDKCGGLTEGLAIAHTARQMGLGVMVGNMMGSSHATAPAFLLGQLCDVVDLDGPSFLAKDYSPSVSYDDGFIRCEDNVWGQGKACGKVNMS